MSRSEPPAASSGSWPSTLPPPGLVQEHVRERVRQVARDRDEPVVRLRVDRDGHRSERGDEPVQHLVAVRIGRGDGRQEPGRALEELGRRPLRPARLGAADRVAADEAADARSGSADAAFGRADVGDGHRRRARVEHRPHLRRQRGDGSGDDGEVGSVERRRRGRQPRRRRRVRRRSRDAPDPDPSRARPRRRLAAPPARPTRRSGPSRRSRRELTRSSCRAARRAPGSRARSRRTRPPGSAAARRRAPPRAAGAPRR